MAAAGSSLALDFEFIRDILYSYKGSIYLANYIYMNKQMN